MGEGFDSSGNKLDKVEKDKVVSLDYTLNVDGEVVDFSDKEEPLEYIQGYGQIIPGLERAMEGMEVGENKEVVVPANEAYGDVDPDAIIEVSKEDFPPEVPIEVGTPLQVRNMDGQVMDAHIARVQEDKVLLDFNHPLAGKDLRFNVTVVGLRDATTEEIEHGHVHGEDGEPGDDLDDLDDLTSHDDHEI